MQLYYFVQKYLDQLTDTVFIKRWESWFVHNPIRFFTTIFFLYMFLMFFIGYGALQMFGFFGFLFLMMLISFYFGYVTIIQTIRFLAINNQRYMLVKMSQNQSSNINYDNVVN